MNKPYKRRTKEFDYAGFHNRQKHDEFAGYDAYDYNEYDDFEKEHEHESDFKIIAKTHNDTRNVALRKIYHENKADIRREDDLQNYEFITVRIVGEDITWGLNTTVIEDNFFECGKQDIVFEIQETGECFKASFDYSVAHKLGLDISVGMDNANIVGIKKFPSGTQIKDIVKDYARLSVTYGLGFGIKFIIGGNYQRIDQNGWIINGAGLSIGFGFKFGFGAKEAFSKLIPSSFKILEDNYQSHKDFMYNYVEFPSRAFKEKEEYKNRYDKMIERRDKVKKIEQKRRQKK